MRQIEYDCVLVKKEMLNQENVFLTFESKEIADAAMPGQFINIKGTGFLRRPFGIASVEREKGQFAIGIKKKAAGTASFFDAEIGSKYSILGPLGHGFSFKEISKLFLIGGGTGIYPLLFVLQKAKELGIKTYVATGFRTKKDILLEPEMRSLATELYIATEDGSAHAAEPVDRDGSGDVEKSINDANSAQNKTGFLSRVTTVPIYVKGYAQHALEQLWLDFGDLNSQIENLSGSSLQNDNPVNRLQQNDNPINRLQQDDLKDSALFCCGPHLMMQKASIWAKNQAIPCQVSMEERMACGFGICRTCVVAVKTDTLYQDSVKTLDKSETVQTTVKKTSVKTSDKPDSVQNVSEINYDRCCVEGPVFPAERIEW